MNSGHFNLEQFFSGCLWSSSILACLEGFMDHITFSGVSLTCGTCNVIVVKESSLVSKFLFLFHNVGVNLNKVHCFFNLKTKWHFYGFLQIMLALFGVSHH